jgi:iron complex outermembrane receptor protein
MKITLLKSLMLVGAILSFGLVKAQDVSGTVSDANGPLPGASIVVQVLRMVRRQTLMETIP